MQIKTLNTENFKDYANHEKVVYCEDPESGLKAIVAIHNTHLGPALGGCRMRNYGSRDEAITDVLRLSKGMTYKSALARLSLGGGKAVILGDPQTDKSEKLLKAMGRFVNSFEGRFITAEDSGTNVHDLEVMATETAYVSGFVKKVKDKGSVTDGDPSPMTALGVFEGVKAALNHRFGKTSLDGVKIAVQGVGNVGAHFTRMLVEEGADVVISDLNVQAVQQLVERYNLKSVGPDEILCQKVDLLAPCALGGVISEESLKVISAPIIAGSANNQLSSRDVGQLIKDQGKLYAPDYVINAGGIIDVYFERTGYDYDVVMEKIRQIGKTLSEIFILSDQRNQSTEQIADDLAEQIFKHAESGKFPEVA